MNTAADFLKAAKLADGSTITTPAQVAAMLQVLIKGISEMQEEKGTGAGQKWATTKQLGEICGADKSTVWKWLSSDICKEKVRVIEPVDYLGKKGVKRYNIADFERVFMLEIAERRGA